MDDSKIIGTSGIRYAVSAVFGFDLTILLQHRGLFACMPFYAFD